MQRIPIDFQQDRLSFPQVLVLKMLEHGNRIKVDPETRKDIIRRYQTLSARYIAKRYPFSRRVVLRILKEAGIPIRKKNTRGKRDTKRHAAWDAVEQVIALYKQGLSVDQVRKRFDCSAPTIRSILKENGVQIRGRHKQNCPNHLKP